MTERTDQGLRITPEPEDPNFHVSIAKSHRYILLAVEQAQAEERSWCYRLFRGIIMDADASKEERDRLVRECARVLKVTP